MFAITVTEKGGEQRRLDFDKPEITIGRVQGNDVILPKGNVSKRHARIVLKDGKFIIVDLKSTNGTYVNGRKITSPLVVKESDKIYIGDFILGVDEVGGAARAAEPPMAQPQMAQPQMASPMMGAPPMAPMGMEPPPPEPMARQMPSMAPPSMAPPPMSVEPPMGRPMAPPPMGGEPMRPPMPPPALGELPMGSPLAAPLPGPAAPPPMGGASMPPPIGMPPMGPPASAPPAPSSPLASVPPPGAAPAFTAPGSAAARPLPSRPTAPRPSIPAPGGPPAPAPAAPSRPVTAAAPPSPLAAPSRPRLVGAGAGPAGAATPAAASPSSPMTGARSRPVAATMSPRRGSVIVALDPKVTKQLELQAQILERLVPRLGLDAVPLERLGDEELWQKAESAIVDLVETMESSGDLPKSVDQDQLIKDTLNEALGLGPLEDLLADEKSDEIVVDRRDRILVGKGGQLGGAGTGFSSDESFRRVVERLVAPTGQKIDAAHPLIDVRLRDGSRLTVAVPPVAVRGTCLTLRKPRSAGLGLSDLVGQGALSPEMADFLTTCVAARKNVLVCGAPGAGKSAILAALAGAAPDGERIVSVEEVAELAIGREEWIALEARPGDGNGLGTVDLVTLLRGALRMRPDRLVVGDVRGAEALELIQAMTSAADGTLAAVAGDGARAALARLAALAQLGAPGSSTEALRGLVAVAVDVVVHVARYADGEHRVAAIEEVLGADPSGFQAQELFGFRGAGEAGGFAAAGVVPRFYAELEARGLAADPSIFRS